MPYDHPLVSGTLAWYESRPTRTGIPLGGGWLAEGIWPGGAMDCPGPVYLRRGEIDRLSNLVYGGLNCGSPVWTWPEERGPDPASSRISGDLQEAWFPVHFCRLLRDCLLYEERRGSAFGCGSSAVLVHPRQSDRRGESTIPLWHGELLHPL